MQTQIGTKYMVYCIPETPDGTVYTIQYTILNSKNAKGNTFLETLSIFLAFALPSGSIIFGGGPFGFVALLRLSKILI